MYIFYRLYTCWVPYDSDIPSWKRPLTDLYGIGINN